MGGLSEEAIMALTSLYMRRTDTTTTSLQVDLTMYDPFSYYVVGEVWVWEAASGATNAVDAYEAEQDGNLTIQRMSVTPSDTNVLFSGLDPDTAYNVAFGYYTDTASGSGSAMTGSGFVQTDYTTVRTTVEDTWLHVDSISMNSMIVSLKVDETGSIPDKVSIYVVEVDEPDSSLITEDLYRGQEAALNVTSGSTIREMKTSGGAGLTLSSVGIFLEEDSPVEYVAVIAVGEFVDEEQSSTSSGIIAGQIVRNPYYGMGIKMDEEGNIVLNSSATTRSMERYSAELSSVSEDLSALEASMESGDETNALEAAYEYIGTLESQIQELSDRVNGLSGIESGPPESSEPSSSVSQEDLDEANARISELESLVQSISSQLDSSESEE